MLKRMYRFRGLGSVRPVMRYGAPVRDGQFTLKALPRRCKTTRRTGSDAMRGEGEQRREAYTQYDERAAEPSTKQRAESSDRVSGSAGKQAAAPCSSRVAVVVSRQVTKSSVARNRIRRRIYEILRLNWDRLDRPLDIAVIVHEAALAELPPKDLEDRLLAALERAKSAAAKPQ